MGGEGGAGDKNIHAPRTFSPQKRFTYAFSKQAGSSNIRDKVINVEISH